MTTHESMGEGIPVAEVASPASQEMFLAPQESMGELVPVAPVSPAAQELLPATVEDKAITASEGETFADQGNIIEGNYINEVEGGENSENGGEEDRSSVSVETGEPLYATETYVEFGPVERKRKLYESLFQKLLSALLGVENVELGPVIAASVRRVPIGFSEYITEKARSGNIPSFDELIQQFPDLEFTEEEEEKTEESGDTGKAIENTPIAKEIPLDAQVQGEKNLPQGTPEVPVLTYDGKSE